MDEPRDRAALRDLMDLAEAGADEAIGPAPARRKGRVAAPAPATTSPAQGAASPAAGKKGGENGEGAGAERGAAAPGASASGAAASAAAASDTTASDAAAAAADAAASASSLEELWREIEGFHGCELREGANKTVIWRGSPKARLAIVGEAPGADEDAEGRPFVGRAGKLLDELLGWAGFGEEDVFITNIVFWRPPGNRAPTPAESAACLPFLRRQLALLEPSQILLLGNTPLKALLPGPGAAGITKARGRWHALEPEPGVEAVPALASFHPAYLLRQPVAKRFAWADLLAAATAWEESTGRALPRRP